MNFSSIKEYFYRLYNTCYLLLILPLGIFIFIYYLLQRNEIRPALEDENHILIAATITLALVVVNLTTVHWVSLKRLKKYASTPGLGVKLDRYYEVVFLRFAAGAVSSLLSAIGLAITGSEYFAGMFVLILALMALQWPTSARACSALKLKGDEYRMVKEKTEKL